MASSSLSRRSKGGLPAKRKYKDSCNNCASSKVKCNKNRPQCSRCDDRQIKCSYGLSQRSGRKRTTTTASQSTADYLEALYLHDPECHLLQNNDRIFPPGTDLNDVDLNTEMKAAEKDKYIPMSMVTPFNIDPWGSYEGLDMGSWVTPIAGASNTIFTPPGTAVDGLGSKGVSEVTNFLPGCPVTQVISNPINPTCFPSVTTSLGPSQTPQFDISSTGTIPTNSPPVSISVHSNHRLPCSAQLSILLSRARSSHKLCALAQPTECSINSSILSFGEVLDINKESIDSIIEIMKCPCFSPQQTAILIITALFEILREYDALGSECARGYACVDLRAGSKLKSDKEIELYKIDSSLARKTRLSCILGELHLVARLLEKLELRIRESATSTAILYQDDSKDVNNMQTDTSISMSVFVQLEADLRAMLGQVRDRITKFMPQLC